MFSSYFILFYFIQPNLYNKCQQTVTITHMTLASVIKQGRPKKIEKLQY